ncbi:MAG TPA: YciI family protein [Caulobacteraceae bacterium]|jgi:hypothetical protein
MKFMVMVRADVGTERGDMPTRELLEAMMKFNQEMIDAGVMVSGDGLRPSSRNAARITFRGGERIVTDGPFAETKELIAGYWIIDVPSFEDAINWMKRCPDPQTGGESVLEIRQVVLPEDFGEQFTPDMQEWEEKQRALEEGRR